ncbi:MAG: O-antigen ligase family protein [Marinobacter sp.]|nr:O-antigen ligase family protein [Marinobacter sp.]
MSKLGLAFLILFFSGILFALFMAPASAFVTYQIVYLVNPDIRWWSASVPGLRYSFITVIVMFAAYLLRFKELNSLSRLRDRSVFKWMVALCLSYIFMINFALLPEYHKRFTTDFIKLVIIMMLAYKVVVTERALDVCLWAYILGTTYIGYVARVTGRDWQGRIEGIGMVDTGGDGNMTAAAMAPALIILIYKAWMGGLKTKLVAIFCGAFIANGIVLINSRGAFLGVVAGTAYFLLYMIFSKYQKKGQRALAILTIIVGLSGGLYVADEAFWERMQTLQELDDGDASGSHRVEFWLATFDIMRDYPMGVGIGGFIHVSQNYLPERYFERRDTGKAVHSTWFQIIGEVGWIGFSIFLAMLVAVFRTSFATKKFLIASGKYDEYFKVLVLEAGLIAFLVAATFIDRGRAEVLYWLVTFILVSANVYLPKSEGKVARARYGEYSG